MNTQGATKTLPIILAIITIALAMFFWRQKESLRQRTQELLDRTSRTMNTKLPTPTPLVTVKQYKFDNLTPPSATATPTATTTVSPTPTVVTDNSDLKSGTTTSSNLKTIADAKTGKTIVCTPVYGMANSCAEHSVVNTALDSTMFYNLAGLSYIFGLAAFVRAKNKRA